MSHTSVAFQKRAVVVAGEPFAVLMLVAESGDPRPIPEKSVIGLGVNRAACFVVWKSLRINSAEIQNRLACYAITVCAFDSD